MNRPGSWIVASWASVSLCFSTSAQVTQRVSVGSGGAQGNLGSYGYPSISADGRFVTFVSDATNLVNGDTNGWIDVFVRDRQSGTTERVSVASDGTQANEESYFSSPISADGRYVAFRSEATNVVPGDTNGTADMFVRDRHLGTTERVSVDSDEVQGNGECFSASISADGRFVAFDSLASNLVPGDTYGTWDVFVRDRQLGTTERASVGPGAYPNGGSYYASISADGRFVAFFSGASNLVPGDMNQNPDVFIRDRLSGTTDLVSVHSGGAQGNYWSYDPSISGDGRFVAFESLASNLVSGDTNGKADVFVHDRQTVVTTRASVDSTGVQGNADCREPSISADGRYVTFWSNASNLVPADTNGTSDIFVHDRHTGTTERASVDSSGGQANPGRCENPLISADGRYVAFWSDASNLVPGDTNGSADVFVRDRATSPDDFSYGYGYVYLGSAQIPMAGVTVQVLGASPPVQVQTNYEGRYVLQGVTGNYRIRAFITYDEPGSGQQQVTIANYPDQDPNRGHQLGSGLPNEIPRIVFPWPVLMQAGWRGNGRGSNSTWHAMQPYLEKDPRVDAEKAELLIPAFPCFAMPNSFEEPGLGYVNLGLSVQQHTDNAARLKDWYDNRVSPILSQWVSSSNMPHVLASVVCHSMGGLIARAFAISHFPPTVNRIVSLDGIHGGTELAHAWALLAEFAPVLRNLPLPTFRGLWPSMLNGVTLGCGGPPPLYLVSPWNASYCDVLLPDRWLLYSCVPDFIVIPDESAWGTGETWFVGLCASGLPFEWVAGQRLSVGLGHMEIHGNANILRQTAQFLHDGTRASPEALPLRQATPKPLLEGHVAFVQAASAGNVDQADVSFDSNPHAAGQVLRIGAGASYEITFQGAPVSLSDLTSQTIAADVALDRFVIHAPPQGALTVELTAGPTSSAELHSAFGFENGRLLSLDASPSTVSSGQKVQLTARVTDRNGSTLLPSGPAVVFAEVQLPDSSIIEPPVQLLDDGAHGDGGAGDGVFGSSFDVTSQEGRYAVNCRATFPAGTEIVDRSATTEFAVASSGASLFGPAVESTPDANGDGRIDHLILTQTVAFNRSGQFRLVGSLVDGAGSPIATAQVNYSNTQGQSSQPINLTFDGSDIARHGVDGPWVLIGLVLYDLDAGALPCSVGSDFATQPYSSQGFEPPDAPSISWITPNHGPPGGSNHVVIHGTGLRDATSVLFGAESATFVVTGDDTLDITVPARSVPGGGPRNLGVSVVDVRVQTPWGLAVASRAYTYTRVLPR